jgi:maltooligosyltrehalose trehalohydrolase
MREHSSAVRRRLPIGAEYLGAGRTHVRVWAPAVQQVEVVIDEASDSTPGITGSAGISTCLTARLSPEETGYFSGVVPARPGDRYRLRLGKTVEDRLYPDPASRFQPEGPHGPSAVVDPGAFRWTDGAWNGASLRGQVIYELHVGTFTTEGTFSAVLPQLTELARVGVTMIEVMPVAEFDGRFGWGYDGVDLYAPSHLYGTPDDFRQLVNSAHAAGLAVILDVVYNHLGPVGNYLRAFSPAYFTDRYRNEWSEAINFDGADAGPVRQLFTANAGYWIDEFHLDGLRLDATHQIFDGSDEHILVAIGRRAREAAGNRSIVLIAENESQDSRLARTLSDGGYGLDGLWNDDFHHSAMVALTGRAEAYYGDTRGDPQELVSAAKYGYLFQGQHYAWQNDRRGTPSWGLEPASFVAFLQNHDQIANSGTGRRGHMLSHPGRWRAMTALLLLGPWTPLLFQGQEFQSSAPFLYFADLGGDLSRAVREGRLEFLTQFPSVVDLEHRSLVPDPGDPSTFDRCKLDFGERDAHRGAYKLHEDLLRLRREAGSSGHGPAARVDGCVLSASALALRFFAQDRRSDRLLLVNMGRDLRRPSFAEPLLAPPAEAEWSVRWSSESPDYGGGGTPDIWADAGWLVPGEAALLLVPASRREVIRPPRIRRTA